jgi:AcrR family transcriptional regulator
MRTTKSQQAKSRRAVIDAAVDLMTQHGFEATTMKQIARAANLGDATIYKYFPSKEKLVLGYFEQAIADAVLQFQKTKGQEGFTLHERMQLLVDSLLEILLADREFVAVARTLVERAPVLLLGDELPGKPMLKEAFLQMLSQAESAGEIVPCGFKPSLAGLMADYVYGVMAYWLRDESDAFGDTTQLVDLSLGVLVLTLRSGLVDKLLELGGFVLRSQLARLMHNGTGLMDLLHLARRGLKAAQR